MRRLVLICMMLLLPLQWTWAAAAAYCEHESSATAQHLGHHEHKHHAATGDKSDKSASKALADNDCGVCHLSSLQWVDVTIATMDMTSAPPPQLERGVLFSSHIPSGPERPDRARTA